MKTSYWKGRSRKGQLNIGQRGEKNSQAKLTNRQVKNIKRRILAGESDWKISKHYGVSHTAIWQIRVGRSWKTI